MDKEKLKEEIEKYLKYYYDVKRELDLYIHIKKNADIYPNETKQISFFIHTVLTSLLKNILLGIAKIIDSREDKNIYKLLEVCNQNIKIFCEDEKSIKEKNEKLNIIKSIKEKIDQKQDLIKKLTTSPFLHCNDKYGFSTKAETSLDLIVFPLEFFLDQIISIDSISTNFTSE